MTRPVIVFDFDKTLTTRDTVLGFYRAATRSRYIFLLKLPVYYGLAVFMKLGLLTNRDLKHWSVRLFLWGKKRDELARIGKTYARSIQMNRIYTEEYLSRLEHRPIVSSASFREYLDPLFPGQHVFASRILYNEKGSAVGVAQNMYGIEKVRQLEEAGISAIDILYTDSFSDKPLMDIAKRVFLIKNGEKKLIADRCHDKEILRTVR